MNYFKFLILIILVLFNNNVFALNDSLSTGIKFEHGAWTEIVTKAKQVNKPIFLDAFASWCGPCKWMSKNIFPNDTVGDFYNKNFVSTKIDMEKGEGVELARKFQVSAYPTFLYISPDGETLLHRTCGSTPADIFIQNGKIAIDPEKQLLFYKKKFENGSSDAAQTVYYFDMLRNACMNFDKEVSAYLDKQKESDLISQDNWKIISEYLSDSNSKTFKYLLAHKKNFENAFTKESVNKKIGEVYSAGLMKSLKKNDLKAFEGMKKDIRKSLGSDGEKVILNAEITRYQKARDWKNFANTAGTFVSKYAKDDSYLLNKLSWTIYENVDDKSILQKAEAWAKHASELSNSYAIYDTYACVLYKLGKRAEAKQTALQAIEIAKKEGADYKSTEELLSKIAE